MSNQETIKELSALMTRQPDYAVALDKAISALQAQDVSDTNVGDMVSRQAAIDIVTGYSEQLNGYIGTPNDTDVYAYARGLILGIERNLNALQSAHPEIVRCKDCNHRDPEDKKCDCGHAILWQLPRQDDWYCADAERRTDE